MKNHSEIRSLFPGAERQTYTDVAVRGLISTRVRQAVDEHLDIRMYQGGEKTYFHDLVEAARTSFAKLINTSADEVGIVKNVSEGINAFATAFPWKAGDNVVVCPELEHPNNVFPWYNLRRHRGIEVREIQSPDNETVPVDRFIDAMDGRTRLVTVPSMTFSPGFVTDVATLASEARARDVLTLIDAAQSIGAMETDVRALGVDACTVATQKSILAFYGMGFLYCRADVADHLSPVYLARYGVDIGADAHETAIAAGDFQYARGARRFDLGNYNYLGAAATGAALSLLHEIGVHKIEQHVRGLAARLASGFADLGLPVAGGAPGPHLGHIVAIGHSGGGRHYTADDPMMNTLYQHLVEHNVKLSIRRGILRFSLAVYNNESDVDRILQLTKNWDNN